MNQAGNSAAVVPFRRTRNAIGIATFALAVPGGILMLIWPGLKMALGDLLDQLPAWLWIPMLLCIVCYGVWDCFLSYAALDRFQKNPQRSDD